MTTLQSNEELREEFEKYYAYCMGVSGSLRMKSLWDFISSALSSQRQAVLEKIDEHIDKLTGIPLPEKISLKALLHSLE